MKPGEHVKVIGGTFIGEVGQVVGRREAFALWEKVGGEKPGPKDPPGMVWVVIPVFDKAVPVLLEAFQLEKVDT
jgi:hypothetical protein